MEVFSVVQVLNLDQPTKQQEVFTAQVVMDTQSTIKLLQSQLVMHYQQTQTQKVYVHSQLMEQLLFLMQTENQHKQVNLLITQLQLTSHVVTLKTILVHLMMQLTQVFKRISEFLKLTWNSKVNQSLLKHVS